MPKTHPALKKLRDICLALPDTKETLTWGEPHFRVGDKIFCGFGEEDGKFRTGFKLTKPHQAIMVKLPGFSVAKYVGRHGWVSLDVDFIDDWHEVKDMIFESYRLIASKASLAKLGTDPAGSVAPRRVKKAASAKKKTGKKVAKKSVPKKKSASTRKKSKRAKKTSSR